MLATTRGTQLTHIGTDQFPVSTGQPIKIRNGAVAHRPHGLVESICYHPQHDDDCSEQESDELHILTNVENGCSKLLVREDDDV
jgi:hypothetical protein